MSIFEHIAADDERERTIQRTATAVANKRIKDRFGAFFANASDADRKARLALVEDDIKTDVQSVVDEYGGDAKKITSAIMQSLSGAEHLKEYQFKKKDAPDAGDEEAEVEAEEPKAEEEAEAEAENPKTASEGAFPDDPDCPRCGSGGVDANNRCLGCGHDFTQALREERGTEPYGANALIQDYYNDRAQREGSTKVACDHEYDGDSDECKHCGTKKESSVHTARRPKMCPYHSEVTDISLGTGDPHAGYNSMSSQAWGDKHCKGGYDGSCNFKPAMVTKQYWDDKKVEYEERARQRELDNQKIVEPIVPQIDTEPIMTAEPLPSEEGEGVTDINSELSEAPSAVGEMVFAHTAADAPKGAGGAVERVSLPSADESGLGGPSPKIDKGNSGDQHGWNLDPIDTEMDGTRHPTIKQELVDGAHWERLPEEWPFDGKFLNQTDTVTEQQTLPSNSGDAGWDDGKVNHGDNTDTWQEDNGTNPVTQTALSSRLGTILTHRILSMPSAMTAQDFVMLADAIATAPGDQAALANHFADYLARTNPNFDRERFIAAATQGGQGRDQFRPPEGTDPQLGMQASFNPLRDLIESDYNGFLPASEVDQAVGAFEHRASQPLCKQCGHPLPNDTGTYCPKCGEPR